MHVQFGFGAEGPDTLFFLDFHLLFYFFDLLIFFVFDFYRNLLLFLFEFLYYTHMLSVGLFNFILHFSNFFQGFIQKLFYFFFFGFHLFISVVLGDLLLFFEVFLSFYPLFFTGVVQHHDFFRFISWVHYSLSFGGNQLIDIPLKSTTLQI